MNSTKKLLATAVAASTMAVAAMAPVANAEVSASVGVANMYLWRGVDLGDGTPAVSGDLNYSSGGFYGGIWGSSGDTAAGNEYDLYVGYGGEVGDFTYDISFWNYVYPDGTRQDVADAEVDQNDTFGDLSEMVVSVGYGPVSFSWYENIATEGGDEEYRYYNLGFSHDKLGVNIGMHDMEESMTHIDFSYAYNDNLSFTLSQVIDDADGAFDDDLNFVVSYSLPIE